METWRSCESHRIELNEQNCRNSQIVRLKRGKKNGKEWKEKKTEQKSNKTDIFRRPHDWNHTIEMCDMSSESRTYCESANILKAQMDTDGICARAHMRMVLRICVCAMETAAIDCRLCHILILAHTHTVGDALAVCTTGASNRMATSFLCCSHRRPWPGPYSWIFIYAFVDMHMQICNQQNKIRTKTSHNNSNNNQQKKEKKKKINESEKRSSGAALGMRGHGRRAESHKTEKIKCFSYIFILILLIKAFRISFVCSLCVRLWQQRAAGSEWVYCNVCCHLCVCLLWVPVPVRHAYYYYFSYERSLRASNGDVECKCTTVNLFFSFLDSHINMCV